MIFSVRARFLVPAESRRLRADRDLLQVSCCRKTWTHLDDLMVLLPDRRLVLPRIRNAQGLDLDASCLVVLLLLWGEVGGAGEGEGELGGGDSSRRHPSIMATSCATRRDVVRSAPIFSRKLPSPREGRLCQTCTHVPVQRDRTGQEGLLDETLCRVSDGLAVTQQLFTSRASPTPPTAFTPWFKLLLTFDLPSFLDQHIAAH